MATATQSTETLRTYTKHYINGAWVDSIGSERGDVIGASTEEVIGRIPLGAPEDVDAAVAAAKAAFETWSVSTLEERAEYLLRIADGLEARSEEIATLISREVGMPISISRPVQAGSPVAFFRNYVKIMKSFKFEEVSSTSLIVREPMGVVGCITPWNYPLLLMALKVAPAMAAGCTVVLKPTELKPLTSFILAEEIDRAGLPKGVFNMVNGTGPVVGEALVAHKDVDMISFTGSTRAGRRISEVAAKDIKKVSLELGGKSACIILEDADLKKAVKGGIGSCYANAGQTCCAQTRMLVPRKLHDEAAAIAKEIAESLNQGDPLDESTNLGALISETQRERVRAYIEKGIEEGATLITGGAAAPEGLDKGYFIRPTVFANVSNDMTIAREEIFGPVLSIIPYEDEDDAVRIANDTIYGLSGGVWSGTQEHAEAVGRRIRTGQVSINAGVYNINAPFGGYKQSGNGRENGTFGFEEFLQVKSMQREAQ
ncbi:aldehyde dehydrogenase family protein [Candidatus Sumerlaeota bacterium]|nr:aldehyde dehydrogenase family protein [Candidatus Sumerlaeota bacterium]